MKTRLYTAIGLALIALALFVDNPISHNETSASTTPPSGLVRYSQTSCTDATESPDSVVIPAAVNDSTESVVPPKSSNATKQQVIAQITIETNIKTQTFDVMPNVKEKTLRHNLGHLPTSAIPGQVGVCVIMGHRDTQFSILKHCEIGNTIALISNYKVYTYTVYDIKVADNHAALYFETASEAALILITCYPVRYTGHAPQRLVVYARLTQEYAKPVH